MLTMRSIGQNDYEVRDCGQPIGRIRYARERTPGIWIWQVQVLIPGPPFGSAKSIGDAKDQFKSAWLRFATEHGADALARAYETMNHANRPGRYEGR